VLLESMVANASGPLRLWLLGRGLADEYPDWLSAGFPTVPMTYLPCDHIDFGSVKRIPDRITISTMDRLLLPQLLDDVARVIYLDIDTLVLGDLTELGRLDLGGSPVAARDSNVSEFHEWRLAAKRLRGPIASELMRRMGHSHGYGRAALNAGVLVLDLDRMRRDDFTRTYLGWVERYGLHDQDVMLAYAGADRYVLEPRWNALPALEDVVDPAIIHWAKQDKPWGPGLTYRRELWQEYAERARARFTAPAPR
jgi:lipopolysaccharide biosynthesis glycosyltransferase